MYLDELYWKFICKFKNFYVGHNKTDDDKKEKLETKLKWFYDYLGIFENKKHLQPQGVPKFERGNIILVELGANVGDEFSGRHYCVVLRDCPVEQSKIFILPLTSKRPKAYSDEKDTIYVKFKRIYGLGTEEDGNTWKTCYANILNVRNIDKTRIIFPIQRGIPNMSSGDLRKISYKIVTHIALRRDLLDKKTELKKVKKSLTAKKS